MTVVERLAVDNITRLAKYAILGLVLASTIEAVHDHFQSERQAHLTMQLMAAGFPAVNARCAVETPRPEDVVVCVKNSTKGLPQ